MFKCVMGAELTGVAYVEDVLRGLETGIEAAQQATKANHKVAKVEHKYLSVNRFLIQYKYISSVNLQCVLFGRLSKYFVLFVTLTELAAVYGAR